MLPFPDISPVALSLQAGPVSLNLKWYALAYITGLLVGWWIAGRTLARPELWGGKPPMQQDALAGLVFCASAGVILGGRAGYAIFYNPDLLAAPARLLALWQPGMSFHGGLIGVAIAGILYARKTGVPLRSMADLLALAAPAGLFLGRAANFVNAELWGHPTDAPWGVVFPGPAALCSNGQACARHPSQLYEAGLEGLILGGLLLTLAFGARALRRPGLIAGVFFLGYGAARIFVEIFREADAQFITDVNPLGYVVSLGTFGLSMGQLLSLPFIVTGCVLVLASAMRTSQSHTLAEELT